MDFFKNIIFLIFFSYSFIGKAQWEEHFTDDDFTSNYSWNGDVNYYKINRYKQLQTNGKGKQDTYLSTQYPLLKKNDTVVWEWYTKLSFNPSSSNFARFYLSSSKENLTSNLEGYYIWIGKEKDQIALVRQDDSKRKILLLSEKSRLTESTNRLFLKVIRTPLGKWRLFYKESMDDKYQCEGEIVDNTYELSPWIGVRCTYTKSRATKFYFDDIRITPWEKKDDKDNDKDTDNEEKQKRGRNYCTHFGEVVFSEVMANPTEECPLPNVEYIEIYNTNKKDTINLGAWSFYYGEKGFSLGYHLLPPQNYLIFTHPKNEPFFKDTKINPYYLPSFPRLLNTGKELGLYDAKCNLVTTICYSDKWYKEKSKKAGGYSLECIDCKNHGGIGNNWEASEDLGGTPGITNSIKGDCIDKIATRLLEAEWVTENSIQLTFSKPLLYDSLQAKRYYSLKITEGNMGNAIARYIPHQPYSNQVNLEFYHPMRTTDLYTLFIDKIPDLSNLPLAKSCLTIKKEEITFTQETKENNITKKKQIFWLEEAYFTPSQTNGSSTLKIFHNLQEENYSLKINVYTLQGVTIWKLQTTTIDQKAPCIEWDGKDKNNTTAQTGVYILYIEAVAPSGKIIKYKKPIVVSR